MTRITDHRKFQYAFGEEPKQASEEELAESAHETRVIICSRPFGQPSVMIRDSVDGFETPLIQGIVHHSPDGFEWGYGGSGPSDLALNILDLILPSKEAWRLHHFFKSDFIAPMLREGGEIKLRDVHDWVVGFYHDENARAKERAEEAENAEALAEHEAAKHL